MPIEQLVAATLGALGTTILGLFGLITAQRAGIGKTQEKLVDNLKDLVDAQEKKITALETDAAKCIGRISDLEFKLQALTDLTITQASEIATLRRR